jgi:hypothetical protein
MSSDLHAQIRSRIVLKETDELLEIWQSNNRFEWSDEAFDIIHEILEERDVEIPEQWELCSLTLSETQTRYLCMPLLF